MKSILCFGDSNTWGYTPGTGVRYAQETRWTGVLQRALGSDFRIIEDGMNARTSVFEDMWSPWRCGKDALPISLISQKPLELLILSLGTNDLKFTDAYGAARGLDALVRLTHMVQARQESSLVFPRGVKVLIVSPICLHPGIDDQIGSTLCGRWRESLRLADTCRSAAEGCGAEFFDAASVAQPSEIDCVHMSAQSHHALGEALAGKVREILA